MSAFVTVKSGEYEYEIQRSRFIGLCRRVENDDEAAACIAEFRRKYRDCTHVCYAYLTQNGSRSCDDGEPSGTAGVPIMECIRVANLCNVLVAVVRYFGGVKLGAGGLLRAYTHTASRVLAQTEKSEAADCDVIRVSFDYSVYKKIAKRPLQSLYKLLSVEYNKTVDVTYAALRAEPLIAEIRALTQNACEIVPLSAQRVEREYTAET